MKFVPIYYNYNLPQYVLMYAFLNTKNRFKVGTLMCKIQFYFKFTTLRGKKK